MKIGVIGTGRIGSTLARKLGSEGHEIRVANSKGPEGVRPSANESGAEAVDVYGAVAGADVIILSIPLPALVGLPKDLFRDVPADALVIDTSNYYPGLRDPRIPELDAGQVESEWVSDRIGRRIVKAFNNILAHSLAELGQPEGSKDRLAIAVAGDDAQTKLIAMNLVDACGFDPVDGGQLEDSWRQQPSTPSYCCDYDAPTMLKGLAAAVRGKAPGIRDGLAERMAAQGADTGHDALVAMNRASNPLD